MRDGHMRYYFVGVPEMGGLTLEEIVDLAENDPSWVGTIETPEPASTEGRHLTVNNDDPQEKPSDSDS